ncbi:F-box protein At3g07870-like [Henckelia pumila]|uniref:F-box protein At3g07870-like n=1 Tax=Henckelia pumila TaxID=405737 RepID=UPI003C6E3A0E
MGYMRHSLGYGFGFVQVAGVYKVIQIWYAACHEEPFYADFLCDVGSNNDVRFDIYNSGSNSWKQMDVKVPHDIRYLLRFELFFNGAIHWYAVTATHNSPCILCFDMSSEDFGLLDFHDNFPLPERDLKLVVLNDCLTMVSYSQWNTERCEIWVMKEYGVKESWTKQFVVEPYCSISPFLFSYLACFGCVFELSL